VASQDHTRVVEVLGSQLTLIAVAVASLAITAVAIFRDVATRGSSAARIF